MIESYTDWVLAKYQGVTEIDYSDIEPQFFEQILETFLETGKPLPIDLEDLEFLGIKIKLNS